MAEPLFAAGRPFRLVLFAGGDHGPTTHRAEVDRLVGEWLDAYVRDGRPPPAPAPPGG